VLTRHAIAVGQMLCSALLVHLSGGRIETHFHVFGSLAFLAFYRDWPDASSPRPWLVAAEAPAAGIPLARVGVRHPQPGVVAFLEHAFCVSSASRSSSLPAGEA